MFVMEIKKCKDELDAKILFSGLPGSIAYEIEEFYAKNGYIVVSNSKNHRMDDYVPLVIPEINAHHFGIIEKQKIKRFCLRRLRSKFSN